MISLQKTLAGRLRLRTRCGLTHGRHASIGRPRDEDGGPVCEGRAVMSQPAVAPLKKLRIRTLQDAVCLFSGLSSRLHAAALCR